MKKTIAAVLWLCLVSSLFGQQNKSAPPPDEESLWAPLNFLIGDWVGEGEGKPGSGGGTTTFRWDLKRHLIVCTNHTEYPAIKDRQAVVYESLLVIYKQPGANKLRASFWDNEGHFIPYSVDISGNNVELLSDPAPNTGRFRLTYSMNADSTVGIKFEIAPASNPAAFAPYLEGKHFRK